MYKHLHKIIINSLLVVLLLGILVMPFTSLALMGYKTYENSNQVLSAQDEEEKEPLNFNSETTPEVDLEKERENYSKYLQELEESTESTTTDQNTD